MTRKAYNKKYEGPCPEHQTIRQSCRHCKSFYMQTRQHQRRTSYSGPEYALHNGIGLKLRGIIPGQPYGVINIRWRTPAQLEADSERASIEKAETQRQSDNRTDSEAASSGLHIVSGEREAA